MDHGVKFDELSTEHIKELINQREIKQKFVALLSDFLLVFKEGQWTIDEIIAETDQQITKDTRTGNFLKIFEQLYNRYQQYLEERQELDFPDLIKVQAYNCGRVPRHFARTSKVNRIATTTW